MTNAFADDLTIQFQRITALHPQLLDAVPPAPLPPMRDGAISFNTADFWKQFAQREWQPRATQSAVNLVGPFRMYGHCLDPVAVPDELHWYDPSTPAQDEDIVLVQWDPAELQKIYERNAGNGDWIRQYGPPCPIATKVYKTIGSSQWLLTRKSMVRLGNNRILGVLRKVVRPESAYVQCPAVSLIEPNAATDPVSSATGSGSIGTIGGSGGTFDSNIRTAVYTNNTAETVTVQGEVSVQGVTVSWDTSYPSTARVYYSYSSSSSGSGSADMVNPAPDGPTYNSPPASASAVIQVTLAAGDTLTLNLRGNVVHTDSVLLDWSSAAARVTAIKR